jgi:hypothetical protein
VIKRFSLPGLFFSTGEHGTGSWNETSWEWQQSWRILTHCHSNVPINITDSFLIAPTQKDVKNKQIQFPKCQLHAMLYARWFKLLINPTISSLLFHFIYRKFEIKCNQNYKSVIWNQNFLSQSFHHRKWNL